MVPHVLSARRAMCAVVCASVAVVTVVPAAAGAEDPARVTYLNPQPGAAPLPKLAAQSWILVDADTGNILAAKDPDHQYPPASTLKVLTAYSLVPRLQMDSHYTAQQRDVNQPGTKIGLHASSTYRVEDLVAGMLMNSGNDAASAVANAYGGWDQAIETMNAEAARLGATNTYALTPNGLDKYDQLSTAKDLAIIFRGVLDIPVVTKIMQSKQQKMTSTGNRRTTLYNHSRMAQNDYPGFLGAKSGYTSMAGHTMVAASKRNGHTLIVAAMRTGMSMDSLSTRVLDWGHANLNKLTPVGHLPDKQPLPEVEPIAAVNDLSSEVVEQVPAVTTQSVAVIEESSSFGSTAAIALGALVLAAAGLIGYRRRKITGRASEEVDLREQTSDYSANDLR